MVSPANKLNKLKVIGNKKQVGAKIIVQKKRTCVY